MFIDPETCPRVQIQIFSWAYPNPTYRFASPAVLWKSMARVPVFVIAPAAINTFLHNIGYSMEQEFFMTRLDLVQDSTQSV